MSNIGTIVRGIKLPIIKPFDNVKDIIIDSLQETKLDFQENDIIAITESLIARAYNNYVTVDDIAEFIKEKYGNDATVGVLYPIHSRNRFSLILKGIARGAKKVYILLHYCEDEVGNAIKNPWTDVDIIEYYTKLVEEENCECKIELSEAVFDVINTTNGNIIISSIHERDKDYNRVYDIMSCYKDKYDFSKLISLDSIFSKKSNTHGWSEFGLLGSNKCGDEKLKLFPTVESCKEVCEYIKTWVKINYGVDIHVMVYGDGCFKDPSSRIWEFADPVSCPYYTDELLGKSPNEIKIKYIADEITDDSNNIRTLIKEKNEHINKNPMLAQGTTPRHYYDLLASLCDLTSGSGDKGTPVVWIQNYFKNYADVL